MKRPWIFMLIFVFGLSGCAKRSTVKEVRRLPYRGDMLYLRNGEEYDGTLKEIRENQVIFVTREGETVTIPLDSIQAIDIQKRREGYWWKTTKDISDSTLKNALMEDVSSYSYAGYVDILKVTDIEAREGTYRFSQRVIRKILNKRGEEGGNNTFYYKKDLDIPSLDFGRTISRDGFIYHIKDIAIQDAAVYARIPLYNRLHERKFAMPEAKPGNMLDFKYSIISRRTYENPLYYKVYFGDKEPVIKSTVNLKYPDGEKINLFVSHAKFEIAGPQQSEEGKKAYKIIFRNWPGVVEEPSMPPIAKVIPSAIFFQHVDSVSYRDSLLTLSRLDKLPSILKEELKSNDNLEDTLKSCFYYVTQKIRFVDIPLSDYSPYPHLPDEIITNRVANSFDKAFLLYSIFKRLGIKSTLILVPDKNRGPDDITPFTPLFYAGAVVQVDSIYLNPEDEFQRFGYISPRYQGTIGFDVFGLKRVEIPLLPPDQEVVTVRRTVRIDSVGTVYINEEREYRGVYERAVRGLKRLKPQELRKEVERMISVIDPRARLVDFKFNSFENFDKYLSLKIEYYIPSYAIKAGDFLLFKIPGLKYGVQDVAQPERMYPVYHDHLSMEKHIIKLYFPRGFTLKTYPGNFNEISDEFNYSAKTVKRRNSLEFSDISILKDTDIQPGDEYVKYREIKLKRAGYIDRWIILKR